MAGPVIAAAVIFYKKPEPELMYLINDSKKLTLVQRERSAQILQSRPDLLSFALGAASAAEIDRLNILQAAFLAMERAVSRLPYRPDFLLVDGKLLPGFCSAQPDLLQKKIPGMAVVGGDSLSVSIAAASILAKVFRDRLMYRLGKKYPAYGFANNAGYGTKRHSEALQAIGPSCHHRLSFKPLSRNFP